MRIFPVRLLPLASILLAFTVGPASTARAGADSDYEFLKQRALEAGKVHASVRGATGASQAGAPLARIAAAGTQVYVHVRGELAPVLEVLRSVGADVQVANGDLGIVQAELAADAIDAIAALDAVTRITLPDYATTRAGSVVTEGDLIHRAEELRGFTDGSGVRVGVISDGIDSAASARASGDLPVQLSTVALPGRGDEGTAMLEIVHDLAPGATLGFCGPATSLEMIVCLTELGETFGADVIVDDLGFFLEPYFQDGPVARAVERQVERGVVYASSAGNSARSHHAARFLETRIPAVPREVHNFGGASGGATDGTLEILLTPGEPVNIILQWNDPFGASSNDYDLVLLDETGTEIIASSLGEQNGDDDPLERLVVASFGDETERAQVVITRFSGEDRRVKLFVFGASDGLVLEHRILAGSIFGHPAVTGVLATAAIDASDPGNDEIQPFSARGPVRIFFPTEEVREKPDIAAVDGVSVTGAGGFPTPFFGTSAAAPHVAGVAALLLAGFPVASGPDVAAALRESAVDLDAETEEEPEAQPAAQVDPAAGAGRMDAVAAAFALNQPPNGVIESPDGDLSIRPGTVVAFTGRASDPEGLPLAYLWQFGGAAPDSTLEDPGEILFDTAGEFIVSFTVADGFGAVDPSPDVRLIRVRSSGGGGGGSCAVSPTTQSPAAGGVLAIAFVAGTMLRNRSRLRARARI